MLTDTQARHGAAAAQGLINSFGVRLSVDGIWSTKSQAAFDSLSGAQASQVNAVVAAGAQTRATVSDLAAHRTAQRDSGSASLRSVNVKSGDKEEIKKLIIGVALQEGVPPDAALRFARVESNFNPKASSKKADGSVLAAGLFQLTDGAIKQIGLPPPGGDKFDPLWNTTVGIKYMKWVARFLNTTFDNVGYIYAGYNLGVGNVKKLQQGKFDDPAVVGALKQQAAGLQTGGAKQYLANAVKFVSTAVV